MAARTRLQKTSVQLSPDVLSDMDTWPGLSRSEAIRLAIERAHYLSTLGSERIAGIAGEYETVLRGALEDLDYEDYRLAARALPSIVAGYVSEGDRTWKYEGGDGPDLDPHELVDTLTKLDAVGRIGVLDCITAERHRTEKAVEPAGTKSGRAKRRKVA